MVTRFLLGIILVAMGLLKLGDMFDLVDADWLWQQPWTAYVAPAALILFGFDLLFRRREHRHENFLQRPVPSSEEGTGRCRNCSCRCSRRRKMRSKPKRISAAGAT